MAKFEYKWITPLTVGEESRSALNSEGAEGWEPVDLAYSTTGDAWIMHGSMQGSPDAASEQLPPILLRRAAG